MTKTYSQILEMHATSIKMLLKGGIRSEKSEQALSYYVNKLEETHEIMHCHHNPEVANPHQNLLEQAEDALVTWANCQSHIELPTIQDRSPCSGCSSVCWGC